ncbi:hypothetical protein [Catenovulum sediminis]|uniref:Uncharacterized protein n=1 Tax=Catenovulum sediminis TaxID=1740262 RepID=A0ABV1RFQ2_9ALTE
MLNSRLLFILIFSFLIFNVVSAESPDVNGSECSRIEINGTLVESTVLKGVAENLGSVVAGKLLYKEPSGYCVPTNETYLISMLDGGYPKIISTLNGHTPSAKMAKFGSEDFLLVFYFAGGNQYVLRPYKFVDELLKEVNGPVFSSNIRSIELVGDTILVKNQVYPNGEKVVIEVESYRYHENQFVLAK